MFFLVLVVVPWLRRGDRARAGEVLRETGERFRAVGWSCFAVLIATGTFQLWLRGVGLRSFADPAWRSSPFGTAVLAKLGLFAAVLAIAAYHDFRVGPRATLALERDPSSAEAAWLRRRASLLGRGVFLIGLLLVALGVAIVRGVPW